MSDLLYIYRIWQDENNDYDTYDSAVVIAASEEDARNTHPASIHSWSARLSQGQLWSKNSNSWCQQPDDVGVTLLGTAAAGSKPGVVCASFNAG